MSCLLTQLSNLTEKHKTPEGDHHLIACCPVPKHGKGRGDQRPSLHIWHPENKPDHLRFWCPAGCTTEEIHEALDYKPPKSASHYQKKEHLIDVGEFNRQVHNQWVTAYEEQRFRYPNGEKKCRTRHWDTNNNKWATGPAKSRRLFGHQESDNILRLSSPSELDPEADTSENFREIWWTEGFHKAKVLHRHGIPAVSMCGGASGKLNATMLQQLDSMQISKINLWIDRDEAGQRMGERLRRELGENGYEVVIWQTHIEEAGADAVDHYAQGYDLNDLEEVIDVTPGRIGEDLGTDKYIANYLLNSFDGTVIFAGGLAGNWRLWNGKLFAGNFDEVLSQASNILESHFQELMHRGLTDPQIRNAKRLLSLPSIKNALKLMQASVTLKFHDLGDHAHPYLINANNGVIDLKTKELLPHSKDFKFVQILPVDYDVDADCREFMHAFITWFPDMALRIYMEKMMGTMLIGTVFRGFLQCWGKGRNGKTAFTETMELILGKEGEFEGYGETVPIEVFIANRNSGGDSPNGGWNAMMFKRAVFAEEPSRGMNLDDGRIKSLTGGASNKDRRLHENTKVKWKPQCTLVIATNEKLRINDNSEGMWDRVRFIPFEARISKAEIKPNIWEDFYRSEAPGILSVMVDAAHSLIHSGEPEPPIPQKVTEAVEEYRSEQDILGQFIEENVVEDGRPESFIHKAVLFGAYQDWCRCSGHHPMNKNNFGKRLVEDRGWDKNKKRGEHRVWVGVRLTKPNQLPQFPPVSLVS